MKKTITVFIVLTIIGLIASVAGWYVRGMYEQYFAFRGVVHTVNVRDFDLSVELRFPSGVTRNVSLPAGSERTFSEKKMGSGSGIFVTVNGEDKGSVGYVLGLNDITVLTFHQGGVKYSTIPYQE